MYRYNCGLLTKYLIFLMQLSRLIHTDIDECTASTGNCAEEATCMNTDGSYTCACHSGYTGDGVICNGMVVCI